MTTFRRIVYLLFALNKCLPLGDNPFSTHVRMISRKTNISYPLICTNKRAYQRVRSVSFSEN